MLDSFAFAGGPFVEEFEKEFAEFCQCKYAVGVGNGTEALWLTMLALGIGKGDEVITVSNTFIATVEAISFCGAEPVFVDIDEKYYTMNPNLIEAAITSKTKAIIPVHLFGQMSDMDPIMDIAKKYNLLVIEDACQAHGAEYKGKMAGSIGDAGCFSFYPGKNLGAYGEAGAVVTNNKELNSKIRKLRDHGQEKKYYHSVIGWNARMDGIQGSILKIKLKYLAEWNESRSHSARLYNDLLGSNNKIIIPLKAPYGKHIYHVYAMRVKHRDKIINYLKEKDIFCGVHYPIPIHLQQAYIFLGFKNNSFPVTERYSKEFLSLPIYPEISRDKIKNVTHELNNVLNTE